MCNHSEPVTAERRETWTPALAVPGMYVSESPMAPLMENPDPQGHPQFAQAWSGTSEPLLDGEPAIAVCERFLQVLATFVDECAASIEPGRDA